jgi:hypothetical protein
MKNTDYTEQKDATDPYALVGGAPAGVPKPAGSSLAATLFNGTTTIGAWITSGNLGVAKQLTLYLSSVGASNAFTIETSLDGTNWYYAVSADTVSPVSATLTSAGDPTNPTLGGTVVVEIEAAPYYRVKCAAADTVIVQHLLKF